MGSKAEEFGVDLITGYSGDEFIYNKEGYVIGIRTKERGVDAKGIKKEDYEGPINILSKITVLAEGARGSLTLKALEKF